MAAIDPWPLRLRLHGGRNTHHGRLIEIREENFPDYVLTACGVTANVSELSNETRPGACSICARRAARTNPTTEQPR